MLEAARVVMLLEFSGHLLSSNMDSYWTHWPVELLEVHVMWSGIEGHMPKSGPRAKLLGETRAARATQ